jgi:hypothetical protein
LAQFHLARVVNAAADPVEDIKNILVVHDSFACHAPRAVRLNQIIRRELAMMYQAGTARTKNLISDVVRHYDPISKLCGANRIKQMPVPPRTLYLRRSAISIQWTFRAPNGLAFRSLTIQCDNNTSTPTLSTQSCVWLVAFFS